MFFAEGWFGKVANPPHDARQNVGVHRPFGTVFVLGLLIVIHRASIEGDDGLQRQPINERQHRVARQNRTFVQIRQHAARNHLAQRNGGRGIDRERTRNKLPGRDGDGEPYGGVGILGQGRQSIHRRAERISPFAGQTRHPCSHRRLFVLFEVLQKIVFQLVRRVQRPEGREAVTDVFFTFGQLVNARPGVQPLTHPKITSLRDQALRLTTLPVIRVFKQTREFIPV